MEGQSAEQDTLLIAPPPPVQEPEPIAPSPYSYTTHSHYERADWKTASFIVALVLLVEAFTLALVLISWEVLK